MGAGSPSRRVARFGAFELDLQSGELRKHGLRVKLQEQPFQILKLLVERPGEVVTREELRHRVWPADTFVDFESGLNAAVKRLRYALGDDTEVPRFVETVPRRGYRFIATVDEPQASAASPEKSQLPGAASQQGTGLEGIPQASPAKPIRFAILGLAAAVGLLSGTITYWWLSPPPVPRVFRTVQI